MASCSLLRHERSSVIVPGGADVFEMRLRCDRGTAPTRVRVRASRGSNGADGVARWPHRRRQDGGRRRAAGRNVLPVVPAPALYLHAGEGGQSLIACMTPRWWAPRPTRCLPSATASPGSGGQRRRDQIIEEPWRNAGRQTRPGGFVLRIGQVNAQPAPGTESALVRTADLAGSVRRRWSERWQLPGDGGGKAAVQRMARFAW